MFDDTRPARRFAARQGAGNKARSKGFPSHSNLDGADGLQDSLGK